MEQEGPGIGAEMDSVFRDSGGPLFNQILDQFFQVDGERLPPAEGELVAEQVLKKRIILLHLAQRGFALEEDRRQDRDRDKEVKRREKYGFKK